VEAHINLPVAGGRERIYLSAVSGEGIDLLLTRLAERFIPTCRRISLSLPPQAGKLRAKLFEVAEVLNETMDEQGNILLEVEINGHELARLQSDSEFSPFFADFEKDKPAQEKAQT